MNRQKTIAVLATLDTKGPEVRFVKNLLEKKGYRALVIDTGILGETPFLPEVSRDEVAQAAGTTIKELIEAHNEGNAIDAMSRGVTAVVKDLYSQGKFDGVLGLGGGQGAAISSAALKALPIGVPKLLVSTKVAQSKPIYYVGTKDIALMPSVVDLAGLNPIIRKVLANAAGSVAGMVDFAAELAQEEAGEKAKPVTILTMLGTTTKLGLAVKDYLESKGSDVLVFHTIGVGGRTLEDYLEGNDASVVIDVSMNEIGNELFGGLAAAGKDRLSAAGRKGIPQIVAPGNVEFINFLDPATVPEHYRDRKLNYHNPFATQVKLTAEEMRAVAREMAKKLAQAKGPVWVVIPLKGFSVFSMEGGVYYDSENREAFISELERALPVHIPIMMVNADINSKEFAEVIIRLWDKLIDTATAPLS